MLGEECDIRGAELPTDEMAEWSLRQSELMEPGDLSGLETKRNGLEKAYHFLRCGYLETQDVIHYSRLHPPPQAVGC